MDQKRPLFGVELFGEVSSPGPEHREALEQSRAPEQVEALIAKELSVWESVRTRLYVLLFAAHYQNLGFGKQLRHYYVVGL